MRYSIRGHLVRCHLSLDFLRWRALRSRAMQNQLNLMSSFEFIAALMSIIIGLGVTNLLAGAGRAFSGGRKTRSNKSTMSFPSPPRRWLFWHRSERQKFGI